jgi:hypothetical protein
MEHTAPAQASFALDCCNPVPSIEQRGSNALTAHLYGFESLPGQKSRPPTREQGETLTTLRAASGVSPFPDFRCDAGAFLSFWSERRSHAVVGEKSG